FVRTKELGFRKDAIINIPIPEQDEAIAANKMRGLKNEIDKIVGVELSSLCNTPPSSNNTRRTGFILEGESDDKVKRAQVKMVDGNYLKLFDLKLLAGTNLADLDTISSFVVNRKFVEVAGFTDPADLI